MTDAALSINKILIRLPGERWAHITEEHCELAGLKYEILETISSPSKVLSGNQGELLAIRETSKQKFLVVIYKEISDKKDGFVITAFMTRNINYLSKRKQIWPSK